MELGVEPKVGDTEFISTPISDGTGDLRKE
jgi:hypothetical protein